MVPDETAIAVPCDLYPAQDVVEDRKHRGVNGKAGEAWTKAQVAKADAVAVEAEAKAKAAVAKADAKAKSAVAKAKSEEAKARVAVAEALEAEAKARVADAEARVAEAEATTKVRVAAAEALEADLKILKLRKEIDVFTEKRQANEQADVEKVVEKPKKRARTGEPGTVAASVSKAVTNKSSEGLQIGQRIEVLFDDPPGYFPGTITGKNKGRWQIEYDDGYREELDLSTTGRMDRKYRLLRGEGLIAGPTAHKAAIPTKRKGRRSESTGLTLRDLIKEGLIEPGQGVLRVEFKGHVFLGDLMPSGSICYEGELWESPSSWSKHVKRSVVPSYKAHDNGWDSVFYVAEDGEETKLKNLSKTHALKMSGFGSYEKETASMGLTLLDLMKEGLMEPGQGVLRVKYKGHVFLADLMPSGSICYEGKMFESPSGWSIHVSSERNGWKNVSYVTEDGEKTTLKQLRRTHALKISGFGSFEKEPATAPKAKPELAARAPAAEQAECGTVHRHQAHAHAEEE
ncbi:MPN domain-containing protein [Chloropicon roscoffensis]|uniref:MPN domain-containing protein n=1 Tax=Chloropicon roscoffensis TaxID=1461544 RepID=A0AAX4PK44_9CHLO